MSKQEFFPKKSEATPTIYAYELPNDSSRKGQLKVGDTNRTAQQRIKEQIGAARSVFKIVVEQSAMRKDGSSFRDYEVHEYLRKKGIKNPDGEWFVCTKREVESAIKAVRDGKSYELSRDKDFAMRPEQVRAVEMTAQYFKNYDRRASSKTPEFLWNAKMRFGKTFTSYQLAKKMGWTKVLVLTFKPAVENSWQEDLMTHVDFEGWQFVSKNTIEDGFDESKPLVCF